MMWNIWTIGGLSLQDKILLLEPSWITEFEEKQAKKQLLEKLKVSIYNLLTDHLRKVQPCYLAE